MNLGDFIFGMGAFVMPILVTYSIKRLGLRTTFFSFAALTAVPLALCSTINLDDYVKEFASIKVKKEAEAATESLNNSESKLGELRKALDKQYQKVVGIAKLNDLHASYEELVKQRHKDMESKKALLRLQKAEIQATMAQAQLDAIDTKISDLDAQQAEEAVLTLQHGETVQIVETTTQSADADTESDEGFATLLNDSIVILCCLAFFFHVPVEACVGAWATTLMIDRGTSESKATGLLSLFWLTFTVSRLIAALGLPEGSHEKAIIGFAVVLLCVMLGLIYSTKANMTNMLVITAGLILGPIFPILIAFLVAHVDVGIQGRAIGLFFCIGGIGWALVPFLVGKQADKSGLQKSFYIVAGCVVGLIVTSVLLVNQMAHL